MPTYYLTIGLGTHVGKKRSVNEDAVGYRFPTQPEVFNDWGVLCVIGDEVVMNKAGKKHMA